MFLPQDKHSEQSTTGCTIYITFIVVIPFTHTTKPQRLYHKDNKKDPAEICEILMVAEAGLEPHDLRVMSPASYQLLHSAMLDLLLKLVLVTGLEPVRILLRRILSPLRLPIPPHEHFFKRLRIITLMICVVKCFS